MASPCVPIKLEDVMGGDNNIPVDRYLSPLSQMMHTMVALLTVADRRSAAETAPPELTPAWSSNTRHLVLQVRSLISPSCPSSSCFCVHHLQILPQRRLHLRSSL